MDKSVTTPGSNDTNILDMGELLDVLLAMKKGDFSKRMPVDRTGIAGKISDTLNEIIDSDKDFTDELKKAAKEIGDKGKTTYRVSDKSGTTKWSTSIESMNDLFDSLIWPLNEISRVINALAKGDFSQIVETENGDKKLAGRYLRTANTINKMLEKLKKFTTETIRILKEMSIDGILRTEAEVKGMYGAWKDVIDNVNEMANVRSSQTLGIKEIMSAISNGDLTKKVTIEAKGEILEVKNNINIMVDLLNAFASEVSTLAYEVGIEGKLGSQAHLKNVRGVWKDLIESINLMVKNISDQMRDTAKVTTAVAKGNLSTKITVDVKGEMLELKNTINTMVDQLNSFSSEVTRVAREVGTEGKLGGQGHVSGVEGIWKDLTDNVNLMASNLTVQMRDISKVVTAIAKGDLSTKISVDARGEIFELKNAINTMVDQLSSFASEVTRVAREVGTEGKLGGQGHVSGVEGIWKDLTDNVNLMVSNLTIQMRDIFKVSSGIAKGDLSTKISVNVKGEMLELKNTVNTMVDQLSSFASEVTRVAREVGTEGKLGGQGYVEGVAGIWKDLTDNVNLMASNLTVQMRDISKVVTAIAKGDLSTKISVDARGEIFELKNAINTMVDQLSSFASEVTRVAREVGTEGKLGGQGHVSGVEGIWKDLTDNVNLMASNLTVQMRDISKVVTAIAKGDLSTKINVEARGEIFELKNAINTMVDQLNSFASEVTRVAREVGTEGRLGAQGHVSGVAGIWKDLTDNVNTMAANLTKQVRSIAKVVVAISRGNLSKKLTVDAEGEIAELTETINTMIDNLASFADQVTVVAREVGVEGKLGGQAKVLGAAGIWKNLTDNVNQLAENLTVQVRAINTVATAVAKGDLSSSVTVEAVGEVAVLKNNVNKMIVNLKETTRKNAEQDWLNTNLAKFNRMLQGQRDLREVSKLILTELAPMVKVQHGAFYIYEMNNDNEGQLLKLYASYGFQERKHMANQFRPGEGLLGQCLLEKQRILLTNVPDDYVKINSALGEAAPLNIVILPIIFEGNVYAVLELASFNFFNDMYLNFLDQLAESIGIVINTVHVNMRTEELLKQSQSLTEELQQQQEELTQTNEELEEKANLLVDQKAEVERKNREVEESRHILEEKAEQLSITSKYKSEFLANMSHELRTPLNSLLVLAQQLKENIEGNLSEKQIEFANIIYDSGNDLLGLINEILDLSKIESGIVTPNYSDVFLSDIQESMERTFQHMAQDKGLNFDILIDESTPKSFNTDKKRILQILKNLISNAFKFTSEGSVTLKINPVSKGWIKGNDTLDNAESVLAFEVADTGIGIPEDKQKIIFEAFQQADGSTSRKYGGTGLGLAISREIAQILGGEICLKSEVEEGSTFTLYLPLDSKKSYKYNMKIKNSTKKLKNANKNTENFYKKTTGINTSENNFKDDRENIFPNDKTLLIIEDDVKFANILSTMARSKGFKVIVTLKGNNAVEYAHKYMPVAIMLDLRLPDIDGWTILERMKSDIDIRHIPVHIISAEDERLRGLKKGALTYLHKPVNNEDLNKTFDNIKTHLNVSVQNLLVLSKKYKQWDTKKIFDDMNIKIIFKNSGNDAIELLKKQSIDCIILDSDPSDMSMTEFITTLQKNPALSEIPIVVYAKGDIDKDEELLLNELAEKSILKEVKSSERLLDEVTLFLHKIIDSLPDSKKDIIKRIYQSDDVLKGKKILIVDDDMRNIFALTSVLERHDVVVLSEENGKNAIDALKNNPDIEVVLMDIMMPEMDGYETIKVIRKMSKFKNLPIIALTAKAMKGDREKCINAGASDYITKPVDTAQLLSLLRVWLYK